MLKLHMQQSGAEFNFYDWFHRDSDVLELDLRRIETTDIKIAVISYTKRFFVVMFVLFFGPVVKTYKILRRLRN